MDMVNLSMKGGKTQSNDTMSGTVKYVKYRTIGIIEE
jgi:hypothetical protein